jgi:hypothetical protein
MRACADEDLALFAKHESRDTRELAPEPPAPAAAPPAAELENAERETLQQIAARHCIRLGISLDELVSPSRHRRLSGTRTAIAREALAVEAATLTEVARFLGRSPSALAQAIARAKPPEVPDLSY